MIYPYIVFFLFITFLCISTKSENPDILQSKSELMYVNVIIGMFMLAFFVGINVDRADYDQYLSFFKQSPILIDKGFYRYAKAQHAEIGYNYFQGIIKTLGASATSFFIIFCFVSIFFRYKFYKNFVSIYDIGIVFFAFLSHEFLRKDCVQIRNGIASAIILYSLIFLYKGQRLRFIIFVLLASSFQITALVAFPLIIAKKNVSKKYDGFLVLLFLFACIISVVYPIKKLMFIFEDIGILPSTVANYLRWSEYARSMSLFNPQLLKQVFITAYFLLHRKKYFCNTTIYFLLQIYLVSTVYYLIFRYFVILAGRFGSLFYAVEAPLLIQAISKSKKSVCIKKIVLCFFYLCFLLLNIYTYNALGWNPHFN